jgi:hypothetical protein
MKCLNDKHTGKSIWRGCYSPEACKGWGYCRQRNIDAGGMKNVTPEDQEEWKRLDNPPPAS